MGGAILSGFTLERREAWLVGPGGDDRAARAVVTGLLGQVREQVPQMRTGVAEPPILGSESEDRLHHRQGH
jgi:hypothetical protein